MTAASGRVALIAGIALIVLGLGLLLWYSAPEAVYLSGRVRPMPYRTRTDPSTAERPFPKGRRVVIPRLGIDAPIVEGSTQAALLRGVWREPQSGIPGGGAKIVLAGHRMRRHFSLLHRVRTGDTVIVYWDGTERAYQVTGSRVVRPTETSVNEPAEPESLVLYSCIPRWRGDRRTVVEALPEAAR